MQAIQLNRAGHPDMAGQCFTDMLEKWLKNDPQLNDLFKALESPVIARASIARDLKQKIEGKQLTLW